MGWNEVGEIELLLPWILELIRTVRRPRVATPMNLDIVTVTEAMLAILVGW